ncbi:polysaccharide pyruvyl transferase family protein [Tianweitania populi]|uniref:Polysaccharide pyruvyl transferase domain-containing protein n=1 Tax=Tianweitania populi TaxID=1607949 RepID=A0A8J3DZ37_9HYPH|nr:polysaccharide pyruvyl transferase family protein [Tianweitania populi]GHD21950.1 hypothetical protein GCM10016234_35800 [Tianweitania populi]
MSVIEARTPREAEWRQVPSASFGQAVVLRCFNVKYSPNLGDGILSECLEAALIALGADPDTQSIDLAARTRFGDVMTGRSGALKVLDSLPDALRRKAVRLPLALSASMKWRPHYAEGLEGASGVVIGGGNLISDIDLNFPTKLPLAIAEAERRNLPVAIYACGAGCDFSEAGLRRLRRAFASPALRAVFVRDQDSKTVWDKLLAPATGHIAQVVRDPGLLASEVYDARSPRQKANSRPIAGLGIISPIAIRYHSDKAPSPRALEEWFVEAASGLVRLGFSVRVFTNGSPEDVAFAARLRPRLASLGSSADISFFDQRTPRELCRHIAGFDVMLAHRMHAVIAAYSYGVPAIALEWDRKLRSFMASVGREQWLADPLSIDGPRCAELAMLAHAEGIPDAERCAVIAEARADVAKLWQVFAPGAAA